jgi:integrase/recombinase XerD
MLFSSGMAESHMYQRKGVWYLRARIGGQEVREVLHTSDVREARRYRDKRLKELKAEVFHGEERIDWYEAVTAWLRHARGTIAPSTMRRYITSLKQVEPHLARFMVDRIDAKAIAMLVQARREAHATPATCKRDLTAVSSVLRHAQSLGQREGNPALDYAGLLRERRLPIRLPTEDAFAAVCAAAPPEFRAFIIAARLTGARQGELVAAKWSDFNATARTLELIGKGSKRRTIALSPAAFAHFSGLPRQWDYIFCSRDGKLYTSAAWDFRRYTAQARRRVTFAPFRFHDLRHWAAVEMLRGGMGVYALSHHLGHGSVSVTEGYLTFLTGEQAQRAKLA